MARNRNERIFEKQAEAIDKLVDTYTRSSRLMNNLADDMKDQIFKRTKLGFGVKEGGGRKRLNKLSQSYKKQRQGKLSFFKKNGVTIPVRPGRKPVALDRSSTTPARSNLTATGSMLDSLRSVVRNRKIFVSLKNNRGTDLYGNPSRVTANQKATFQAKAGRRFLDLAKFEEKLFARRITKEMLSLSNRILSRIKP